MLLENKEIKENLWQLKKHELKEISMLVNQTLAKKYLESRHTKYLTRGYKAMAFPDVEKFFKSFYHEEYRYKILFLTQAWLGLRIGEAIRIRLQDIDFNHHQIRIFTEKKQLGFQATHFLRMHVRIENELKDFVAEYNTPICAHEGYLFFPNSISHSKSNFVSASKARTKFREVCDRCGLNEVYAEREKRGDVEWGPTQHGKLYRYSTHSLRHAFCRYVIKRGNDILVAKELMRHDSLDSTMIYAGLDKEEIDVKMERTFADNI